jgi:hypothetical protein
MRGAAAGPNIDAKEIAMIPYDIDPSLHDGEPQETLDDGFSPPSHHDDALPVLLKADECELEAALAAKSPF